MYLQLTKQEIKPSLYLRTLTNEELLRYAEPVTELESELLQRLEERAITAKEYLDEAYNEVRLLSETVKELEEVIEGHREDYDELLLKCNSLAIRE